MPGVHLQHRKFEIAITGRYRVAAARSDCPHERQRCPVKSTTRRARVFAAQLAAFGQRRHAEPWASRQRNRHAWRPRYIAPAPWRHETTIVERKKENLAPRQPDPSRRSFTGCQLSQARGDPEKSPKRKSSELLSFISRNERLCFSSPSTFA